MPDQNPHRQPCPTGRVEIRGKVLKCELRPTKFGMALKMAVRDERGFTVWVTCPSAISEADRGDRVEFTATIQPSNDDPMFGFGKRPTKAKLLSTARAPVAA